MERYLTLDMPFYLSKAFARFRSSSHKLAIEIGHHHGINRTDRICTFCFNRFNNVHVEDEFHVFFNVPRLFEEKRRDIVFGIPSSRPPNIVGTLCAQLLLQFYADSFETLQIFLSWSEDMHVVWILPEIIFCHFFHNLNLVIFRRFYCQSEKIVGTLCAQLLLQFYIYSFETSQVFCTWSEDMHVVWI